MAVLPTLPVEDAFDARVVSDWMGKHPEIPCVSVVLYLIFLAVAPRVVKAPLNLKTAFAFWNFLLSAFSIVGAARLVPHLLGVLRNRGFAYTLCEDPISWYSDGAEGLWCILFILSKIPELGDTVFLALRRKPVIFLHWYHHATVLLYCWHSGAVRAAPGIWFAAMNFSVHSVMYLYFGLANFGFYKLVQPFAPFITACQILQMVGGIICLTTVAFLQKHSTCNVDPTNVVLGLGMYFSYFILFAYLFLDKYLTKKEAPKSEAPQASPAASGKPHAE